MNILDIAIAKQLAGGSGGSGTDNYNDLSNLPKINDTTLSGNKSSSALGLQSEITSDSKLASDLVDDTNQDNKFVTSSEKNTWNGKQNAIDADHKINADYVDDSTSTNKFVTASDKETWNAKQNAIDNSHKLSSDLVDDTNHTNKFVTSTEKNTWNAKQNAIDADHKLSSSLVSFSAAEAAALASGIDSSKVGQISTNQTNILYVINTGVKNWFDVPDGTHSSESASDSSVCSVENGVIKIITCSTSNTRTMTLGTITLPPGTYILTDFIFGPSMSNRYGDMRLMNPDGSRLSPADGGAFTISEETVVTVKVFTWSTTALNQSAKPFLCVKAIYDQDSSYQPPALPNYDLTYLEAEDRVAIAEEIDAGAKNKVDIASITTTGSSYVFNQLAINALPAGSYVFSYSSTQSDPGNIQLIVMNDSATLASVTITSKSGSNAIAFTINGTATKLTLYSVRAGIYSDFMVCTKAAFGVSQKFVPYKQDPFYQVPINHNMIYRGQNLGATFTDAQHTALSSGNFSDLYLGDYWTKSVTIPAGTYTGGDGQEVTVPAQTVTLKAVIADFDTFYAGYASSYAGINTHHAAVIITGFSNVVWNKTNSTAGGYKNSLIHRWLDGSALSQIEAWFGSDKVLWHKMLLTTAITGDAASNCAWSDQKISLLSENQVYGSKVWGNSKAANGGYEPGEAFKHLNIFNHIDANLLFGNKNIWLRDIASAVGAADLNYRSSAYFDGASNTAIAPAALILLS